MTTLSEDQINDIFLRWYQGEKVTVLLNKLGIEKIHNRSFAKHFSPIPCQSSCPYCFEDLYAFRSDPAYYKKNQIIYDISTAHCLNCGHDINKFPCKCKGCEQKRIEEKSIKAEKEAYRLQQRQIHLEQLYEKINPINFENVV